MNNKVRKVEDLKAGMVVEIEDKGKRSYCMVLPYLQDESLCISGEDNWFPINCFNEDFEYVDTKVLKVYGLCSPRFAHRVSKEDRRILWEREKEVDWSKVPLGTKVLVADCESDEWIERIFVKYVPGDNFKFKVLTRGLENVCSYRYCKLVKESK